MSERSGRRGRGRPKTRRRVVGPPPVRHFGPIGNPTGRGAAVELSIDEAEALRLADLEAVYHEEAAAAMGVSRSTYGRILESARHKLALFLWQGGALMVGGGDIEVEEKGRGAGGDRGDGGGRAGRGHGMGGGGNCVCPRCGLLRPHIPGRPCRRDRCPECDVPLMREGGEHHCALLEARSRKSEE